MVAKTFEDFFKVKKNKKINKKERRIDQDVKQIKSIEEAEEWDLLVDYQNQMVDLVSSK